MEIFLANTINNLDPNNPSDERFLYLVGGVLLIWGLLSIGYALYEFFNYMKRVLK